MDFHNLARRDLQALCKKNQIAANDTNIAMANKLASLQQVEGLDEFLNPPKHDVTQSPETEKPRKSVITRSMTRASTRRTILEPETEQQLPSCMQNRNTADAAADKESKVLDFTETPAVLRTKKRTESSSVQLKEVKEKVEGEKNEEGDAPADGTVSTVAKTRQGKTRASVTQSKRMYSRRSTRLLEKKINDLKLCDEVIRDLTPIKMSELDAEKDLTNDLEDAIMDERPSESVKEDSEAKIVACEVEALAEVESKIEEVRDSESVDISKMSETKAAESEVDTTPVEVESEGNIADSQLMADVHGKKSNECVNESEVENVIYDNCVGEDVANEVEATVEIVSEIDEEIGSHSTEIYGKKEITAAESDVDATVEVENDSRPQNSQVIANVQDEKIVEVDESLVGQIQEGLTSVEEAAAKGDDISELTAQVTSLNLNYPKIDFNQDMDSGAVEKTAVPEDNDVMLDGYLADSDAILESNLKVESLNGDGKLEIHGDALSEQRNNPIANSAVTMELGINIGRLFDAHVTGPPNLIRIGDSDVKLPEEDIFSSETPASIKKAGKVCLSPLSVVRLTELPTPLKSSSKKMQLKDENKENVGGGVEFGKIIAELPVANEPTPLTKKSLGQLKKLLRKKIQMQNDKRLPLQMVQENNSMAVAGEKDD